MNRAPWLAEQATQLLSQPGHALLLHGPSGLGQYTLALDLARAWLCETPVDGGGACGTCGACHAIDVRTHADLFVLLPETVMLELDWPLSEKAQKDIDDKKRKPSREIRVEAMRDAIEFSQRTNSRGRGKVVLVYPAERMNHITANALLKTLEEPPGEVRFLLATEAGHQLLPTIRSRCLSHAMRWPSATEALAWLQEQGVAAADAGTLFRAAGARPEAALALARSGRTAKAWSQLPKAIARGELAALGDASPPEAVDLLQKVCHDVLATRTGGVPRFFDAGDLPAGGTPGTLAAWWRDLTSEQRTSEHPFNGGLMLESLVARARAALH